jgi:hypothetical protein
LELVDSIGTIRPIGSREGLNTISETPPIEGVIADGLSPLLFSLRLDMSAYYGQSYFDFIEDTRYRLKVQSAEYPELARTLTEKLFVLTDVGWLKGDADGSPLTKLIEEEEGKLKGFAYLGAMATEAFKHYPNVNEFSFKLIATAFKDGHNAGDVKEYPFRVRRPPVVLVHGYNSDAATWSPAFLGALAASRTPDFVIPINYGVDPSAFLNPNTTAPFAELAGELDETLSALADPFGPGSTQDWRSRWQYTQYDVVGHSQGGVLLRMLCAESGAFSRAPFVNAGNLFQGRFRRVVTIGSPHNGTRLALYLEPVLLS